MNEETMKELLVELVRDLYDAEKQIVKALPKLAKAVESEELRDGLQNHLEETQNHVTRLEKVFGILGENAKGKSCKGMKGLLEEGNEAVSEEDKGVLRDLAIIAGCQKVEHYEMSAYGTTRTLAEHLGLNDAVNLFRQTEDEEKAADSKLTEVATSIYESSGEEETEEENEAEPVGASSSRHASGSRTQTKRKAS